MGYTIVWVQSEKYVELKPGFEVQKGAVFKAISKACD
jgi:hypothetical protein